MILYLEPELQELCKKRYPQFERDDCMSEMKYVLIRAVRSNPPDSEFFWQSFQRSLDTHMQGKKKELALLISRKALSLDARHSNGRSSWTLYDLICTQDT